MTPPFVLVSRAAPAARAVTESEERQSPFDALCLRHPAYICMYVCSNRDARYLGVSHVGAGGAAAAAGSVALDTPSGQTSSCIAGNNSTGAPPYS